MAKLFVLLKIKDASGIGWLQNYTSYGAYTVSYILDEYQDTRLDLQKLNADVLTHAQAKSAIFADAYRGYINLKLGASITEDFPDLVITEDSPKVRYDMTADDFASGVNFNKIVFKKYIRDRFNDKVKELRNNYSILEQLSFEQQKQEAAKYVENNSASVPMLTTLAIARSITVAQLVEKINLKVTSFNNSIAVLLGQQKVLEDEVDVLSDLASCHRWRHKKLGIGVTAQQFTAEPELGPPALKIQF
jgi:hypothetical protein